MVVSSMKLLLFGFFKVLSMKNILFTIFILLNSSSFVTAQNNNGSLKPEKIYLHTDRDTYIAGEFLFYTLYLQGNPGQMSKYAYLAIRNKSNSYVANIRLEINNQVAFGTIFLSDTLNSDVYQVVCYTNCMRNYSEDSYFKKEIVITNRFDKNLNLFSDSLNTPETGTSSNRYSGNITGIEKVIIHLDKQVFDQREKISFSIEPHNISENSISYLSVSVSEIVPGTPNEPSISEYFNDNNIWKNKGESERKKCSYSPEVNGAVLQGRVLSLSLPGNQTDSVNRDTSNEIKIYTILVSTADSISNMQYYSTDSLGLFNIHLNPYYDGKDLFVRIKENVKVTIEPETKFCLIQPFNPSDKLNVPGIKSFMLRSGNIAQIQKFYNEQVKITTKKEFLPGKIVPRIYFSHYSTIFPSDFIELPDFVEISKEIVPALKVRKTGDKFVSGYVNFLGEGSINLEPTIFLDGVPIDDVNQIINLGSSQIKRIESLPGTRYYGKMSFSGILAVFSKDLLIDKIQFKTPTIKYQALSSQSYTKPEPFKPINSRHIPDLRQLLLWEPEIILDNNENQQIECFASDLPGKFRINIQGITSTGDPVNGSAIITIQSKSK